MTSAVGQSITKVVSIRDGSNVAIEGLLEDDFQTLEAYLVSDPDMSELVILDEINDGQYALSFIPSQSGSWALHHVYADPPVFLEDTSVYQVDSTAEIVVVSSGGTWTYAGDLTDPMQLVRFMIQDTDGSHPQFVDSEINYYLTEFSSNARRTAISLLERLMARYAGMADTTELDLSVRASQLYDHYKELWMTLRNNFSGVYSVKPYVGGIRRSDMLSNASNRDRVTGVFDRTNLNDVRDRGGVR